MTAGAAVLGAAGALAAAGARRPLIRRWPRSVVQAVPCTVASEFPVALGALHLAATVVAPLAGRGRGAAVAAGLNLLAAAALVGLRNDMLATAAVLERALAPFADPAAAGPPARLLPAPAARRRFRRVTDVPYGPDPAQRLDVWVRPDLAADAAAPVLVQVHGGGWTGGDKLGQAEPLLAEMAAHGWVGVSVNYRLAGPAPWPAPVVDVKRALAWVRRHVGAHGGDPGFVAVTGGSAGGHLAALAAVTPNDPAFQPGFPGADTSVAAAVPLYGVFDFGTDEHGLFDLLEHDVIGTPFAADRATWLASSPLHRAGPDAPPFLVVHGDTDTIASVGQSRRFVARLAAVSREPVLYAELPRAQHGFDALPTRRTAATVRGVRAFLTAVHDRYRVGHPVTAGGRPSPPAGG